MDRAGLAALFIVCFVFIFFVGLPGGIGCPAFFLVLQLIDLAVGRGCSVDHAGWAGSQRLHLKFFRLKNDG